MLTLKRFHTIGNKEERNLMRSLSLLSGYLGGIHKGGYWIERLKWDWANAFQVPYVIPCNSATSGLLAACMAAGVRHGDTVLVTNYSMSATAACAMVLGARVGFVDIEPDHYGLDVNCIPSGVQPKALIVTNLFGHPARLRVIREWCDQRKVIMIEDNAQAPFASELGHPAGTIGHIGVFSLNVHKHIQCGEGGVVVSHDEWLGQAVEDAINHGELRKNYTVGLNLRMTEPIAAIACAQLARAKKIIAGRIELAEQMTEIFRQVPEVIAPFARAGCRHVYYVWAARIWHGYRDALVTSLTDYGLPIKAGYCTPLSRLFKTDEAMPVTDDVEREIMTFEICAYDPSKSDLAEMRDIVARSADEVIGSKRSRP